MKYQVTIRAGDYLAVAARAAARQGLTLDIPATLQALTDSLTLELSNRRGIRADVVALAEFGDTEVSGDSDVWNERVRFIVDICSVWEPNRFGDLLSARYAEVTA